MRFMRGESVVGFPRVDLRLEIPDAHADVINALDPEFLPNGELIENQVTYEKALETLIVVKLADWRCQGQKMDWEITAS